MLTPERCMWPFQGMLEDSPRRRDIIDGGQQAVWRRGGSSQDASGGNHDPLCFETDGRRATFKGSG